MGCKVGRFAINRQGMLVQARHALISGEYCCAHCGHGVYVRRSKCGRAFFAHAISQNRKQTHNFSEHRMIQETLGQMFAALGIFYKLEYEVCAGLRADVFFCLKKNFVSCAYVIEVQKSPITCSEIAKRIQVYEESGIGLIWIIPKRMRPRTQLRQWEQYLVAYAPLLLFYDQQMSGYYYASDYLKCSITNVRIAYGWYDIQNIRFLKRRTRTFPRTEQLQISEQIFQQELIAWRKRQQRYLQRIDNLQQLLYQLQMQVDDIPQNCYTSSIKFLSSKQSVFLMQSMLYLFIVKQGWDINRIIKYCVEHRLLLHDKDSRDIVDYVAYVSGQAEMAK